jgi:hypothetical protein
MNYLSVCSGIEAAKAHPLGRHLVMVAGVDPFPAQRTPCGPLYLQSAPTSQVSQRLRAFPSVANLSLGILRLARNVGALSSGTTRHLASELKGGTGQSVPLRGCCSGLLRVGSRWSSVPSRATLQVGLPFSHSGTRSVLFLRPAGTSRPCFSGSFHNKSPAQLARGVAAPAGEISCGSFPKSTARPWEPGTSRASRRVSRVRYGQSRLEEQSNGTLRKHNSTQGLPG